jgi:preprotein translocase subunit YajC
VQRYFLLEGYVLKKERFCLRMVTMVYGKQLIRISLAFLFLVTFGQVQTPTVHAQGQAQGGAPSGGQRRGPNDRRGPAVFGKITAINKDSVELAKPDGTTMTVKITDNTEYSKDRQGAKLEDFKVGDLVFVRGEENADHSVTAQMVGGRSGGGPERGRGPGGGAGFGELGKDFVVGEVKSVDAPKLTVLRPDNVTQTLELNEETSLRKGRESITMADIQAGDHVVVRGGIQNNMFVPKNVIVLSEEQWKRMGEMGMLNGKSSAGTPPANAPKSNPQQPQS